MRFSAFIRRISLALVLLALFLGATVPKGMMQVADAGGMRLVLCTTDGPREMVLAEDGTIHEIPVGNHDGSGDSPCLAVSLSFAGLQVAGVPALMQTAATALSPALLADVAPRRVPVRAFASRAPPALI